MLLLMVWSPFLLSEVDVLACLGDKAAGGAAV